MLKKWLVVFLVITLLVSSNITTYYVAPYLKKAPEYIVFVKEEKQQISTSEMDKEAYVAVVVKNGSVIADEKKHCDWAQKVISEKSELQWEYHTTQIHLGHTGIVFKLVEQPEKMVASQ